MDIFVLDTTAITEARIRAVLGLQSVEDVVRYIIPLLRDARIKAGARFYMTPTTWNELRRSLVGNNVPLDLIQDLATWITVKAPDKLSLKIPAAIFSEYVADVRRRLYKGLRVAEYAARRAARDCVGAENECLNNIIRDVRDKYREATRKGLVDSIEDLDTILLALELKATVVASDEGITKLAQQLGVIHIDPTDFIQALTRIVKAFTQETK